MKFLHFPPDWTSCNRAVFLRVPLVLVHLPSPQEQHYAHRIHTATTLSIPSPLLPMPQPPYPPYLNHHFSSSIFYLISFVSSLIHCISRRALLMFAACLFNWNILCQVCGKKAAKGRKDHMRDHIETNHLEGVSHPCSICGKTYK